MNSKIISALKKIKDPELGIDIYTLGLIYGIKQKGNSIAIKMTFTTPLCPYGQTLVDEITDKLKKMKLTPKIELVFEPPWTPSKEVREMLGMVGD